MEGFRYNGKHSSEMNVYYIPDERERGDYYSDFEIIDLEHSWASGGDFFHSRVKTRIFTMSCFYDGITYAQKERIIRWLDRRTNGELVFDGRPYAYYYVCPTQKIEFKDYLIDAGTPKLFSGTFEITFSAYHPYACFKYSDNDLSTNERLIAETGAIPNGYMPPAVSVTDSDALIYNPGTEIGHSIIRIAGKIGGSDLTITNAANGSKCTIKHGFTTGEGQYLEINSMTGRVELISIDDRELNFAFHDDGYITFVPCFPFYRSVDVETTANNREIISTKNEFTSDMLGSYILLNEIWVYIGEVKSAQKAVLNTPATATASVSTPIVKMNYLTINKALDAEFTKFEILCIPEVR